MSCEYFSCPVCSLPLFCLPLSFFPLPFLLSLLLSSFLFSCFLSLPCCFFTLLFCSFPSIKLEILILANMVIMERSRSPVRTPSLENEPRPLVNFPVWTRPMGSGTPAPPPRQYPSNFTWGQQSTGPKALLHWLKFLISTIMMILQDNQVCLKGSGLITTKCYSCTFTATPKGSSLPLDLQYKAVWHGWVVQNFPPPLHHGDSKVKYGQDLPIMVKIHPHRQDPLHNQHRVLLFPEHLLQGAKLFQGEPPTCSGAPLESR